MVFSSITFLFFFLPALLFFYYIVPQRALKLRNFILLLFSITFYAWGGVRYLGLLAVSVLINYLGGLFCGLLEGRRAKAALIIAMALNLGLLAVFKYANFATGVIASLGFDIKVTNIVLPIGISFFTFQGASYVIDVYRKDAGVQKNPLNVALYVALFPQLVAGPIVRYTTVENEIMTRKHSLTEFSDGLTRFIFGLGKKMIIANAMGEVADGIFSLGTGEALSVSLAWVGALAYTMQIYFDFSAYSDMAIGLGHMFAFRFEENFNYPYIATSITDFWRRWHISLSTWFRDYVYIPLGGNRCSVPRHIFNLMVVWSLTGLWHGANWTFIVWGIYFGVLLIAEKYVFGKVLPHIPVFIRYILTMVLVIVSWVLFRSDSLSASLSYLSVMFGRGTLTCERTVYYLRQYLPEFIAAVIFALPTAKAVRGFFEKREKNIPLCTAGLIVEKAAAAAVFALSYVKLVSGSFNPFIYFQF